jgi:hypothetical protein
MRPDDEPHLTWKGLAMKLARETCEENFSTRWGVFPIEDADVLCFFNNHFYRKYPTLRDEEMAKLKERLEEVGIQQLGYATYPTAGPDDGYSCAMVLQASVDQEQLVVETFEQILEESWEWMKRQGMAEEEQR